MALLSGGECLSEFPNGQVVVVASGYEAAAELLTAPTAALVVDLCRLTQPHVPLLALAAKLEVPVLAFGDVSARIPGQALAKVQLASEGSLEDALVRLLTQAVPAPAPTEAAAASLQPLPTPTAVQAAPLAGQGVQEPAPQTAAAMPQTADRVIAAEAGSVAAAAPPAEPAEKAAAPPVKEVEPPEPAAAEPMDAMYAEPDEVVDEPQGRQGQPAHADYVEATGAGPADAARDEATETVVAETAEAETLDAEQVEEPAAAHEGNGFISADEAVQYQSADAQLQANPPGPAGPRRPIRTPRPSDILTQEELDALLEETP